MADDLLQLQRLGIDIWVSRPQAQALIESGEAQPMVELGNARPVQARSGSPSNRRAWSNKKPNPQPNDADRSQSDERSSQKSLHPSGKQPARSDAQADSRPFEAHLKVFLWGPVALIRDFSIKCPDELTRDVVRALSGFADHQFNELHFHYPVRGNASATQAHSTLAGAQEGFQAWFQSHAQQCNTMLVVGEHCQQAASRFLGTITRKIVIDEMPQSRDGKQQLWTLIKQLNA